MYTCIYIYVSLPLSLSIYIYVYIYIYIYAHMYVYTHMYMCMWRASSKFNVDRIVNFGTRVSCKWECQFRTPDGVLIQTLILEIDRYISTDADFSHRSQRQQRRQLQHPFPPDLPSSLPLAQGQQIAHQKSTPQKSSWIFSGVFQWMFSGIFQHYFTCLWSCPTELHFSVDVTGIVQWISSGILKWNFTFVMSGVQSFAPSRALIQICVCIYIYIYIYIYT